MVLGPGLAVIYISKSKYTVANQQPSFPETSKHASCPYGKQLLYLTNDICLETVMSTESAFANSVLEANTRKTIEVNMI